MVPDSEDEEESLSYEPNPNLEKEAINDGDDHRLREVLQEHAEKKERKQNIAVVIQKLREPGVEEKHLPDQAQRRSNAGTEVIDAAHDLFEDDDDDVDELQLDHTTKTQRPEAARRLPNGNAGDEIVSDGHTLDGADVLQSNKSSPLSSIYLSDEEVPDDFGRIGTLSSLAQPDDLERSSSVEIPAERESDARTTICVAPRNFRPRNPEQLHPYAIESERYKRTLKGRGIQPLRIAQETNQDDSEASGTEEQDSYKSPIRRNQMLNRGSPNIPSSPPRTSAQDLTYSGSSQATMDHLEDEDFPDLSAMLRKPLPHETRRGFKKVKTSHTYSKQDRHPNGVPSSHLLPASTRQQSSSGRGQPPGVFDIPPSPPTSGIRSSSSDAIMPSRNLFPVPIGLASPHIQTPAASSESPGRHHNTTRASPSDTEPVRHSERRHRRVPSSGDPSGDPSGGLGSSLDRRNRPDHETRASDISHSSEEEQLHRVQRKIRGVLPASWLRLDMMKGAAIARNHIPQRQTEPPISPERDQTQRGVARPLLRPQRSHPPSTGEPTIIISDESSSEGEDPIGNPQQQRGSTDGNASLGKSTFDWPDSDSMEDDRIDPMLQTATRQAGKKPKKPRMRQTVLSYDREPPWVGDSNAAKRDKTSFIREKRRNHPQNRTNKGTRPRNRRTSKSRLGILDVDQTSQSQWKRPAFINLAIRSACSRRDCGRQSPSRKVFKLATREDTADVQKILASWKNGLLIPKLQTTLPPSKMAFPLNAISGNERPPHSHRGNYHQPQANQKYIDVSPDVESLAKGQRSVEDAIQSVLARRRSQGNKGLQATIGITKPPLVAPLRKPQQTHISSTVRARNSARPALLEILATATIHAPVGPNSYKTPRPLITTGGNFESNPILDRFLAEHTSDPPINANHEVNAQTPRQFHRNNLPNEISSHHLKLVRRHRKPSPKQLDVRSSRFHQAIEIKEEDRDSIEAASARVHDVSTKATLCGLGPYGTEYPLDFGIESGVPGPHFWEPITGENLQSAKIVGALKRRKLEQAGRETKYLCFGKEREWAAWTESLHSELFEVFKEVVGAVQSISNHVMPEIQLSLFAEAMNALDTIAHFFAQGLYFLDFIDRISFTRHALALISMVLEEVDNRARGFTTHGNLDSIDQSRKLLRDASIKVLIILTQIQFIAIDPLLPSELGERAKMMVEQAFRQSVKIVLFPDLKETWLHIRRSEDLNTYRSDENGQAACIGELLHIAADSHLENVFHEESLQALVGSHTTTSNKIRVLERTWRDLFTLLPFFRNTSDSARVSARWPEHGAQYWSIVKCLVGPVLTSYKLDPRGQAPTFNIYLRTVIGRCLVLVQQWNWQRPEGAVGTFFDFFASNNLANLEHEYSYGPSLFLQQLTDTTQLVYLPRDSGFQICLKLLGSSLRSMRSYYPSKKIRDIAWRYMPNHGRILPKDQSIRQEDLEALRNHHDLLCVLYWALPLDFRPRVSAIQDLVQIETSHREACHINIRAWSNLVAYKLSTNEAPCTIEPFTRWISNVLTETLQLHRVARSEVESQAKAAELNGFGRISPENQEALISRNQRQVEAILEDTVVSIRTAITITQTSQAANVLFPCSLSQVLEMSDPKRPRTNNLVITALKAYSALAQKHLVELGELESQNYGDWSAFGDEGHGLSTAFLEEKMLHPVHRLLSNAMGTDNLLEESLVAEVVDTWIIIVHLAVIQGSMTWDDVLGPYGSFTWTSLRDTEQTRKYTPYAFASLLERDKHIYQEHGEMIYKVWLASCLERDSMLKYQHLLTAAVLNCSNTNPLFNNMDSTVRRRHDRCINSINDFRYQRIGLLSTMLATMRENLDYRTYHELGDGAKPKQDFVDLMKHMMSTMKINYQELGTSTNHSGAYVEFVHMVVSLLQQYAADICPIDRFFVDSLEFPAPATDPAYVVDRILNYARRFPDAKSYKQLASLIQNLCERAVIEDSVEDLADQLESALHLNGRDDYATKEKLLNFMLDKIAPAYVEVSFGSPCGWLLAQPILMALRSTFASLVSWLEVGKMESRDKMALIISHYLELIFQNIAHWVDDHRDFHGRTPSPSPAWGMALQTITAILPLLDYLYQKAPTSDLAASARNQSLKIKRVMRHYKRNCYAINDDELGPGPFANERIPRSQYDPIASFTLKELKSTLSERWQARGHEDGAIYTKSSLRSEWIKVADGYSRDTDTFLHLFQEFNRVHVGLIDLCEHADDEDEDFRRAREPEQGWDWRDEAPPF